MFCGVQTTSLLYFRHFQLKTYIVFKRTLLYSFFYLELVLPFAFEFSCNNIESRFVNNHIIP